VRHSKPLSSPRALPALVSDTHVCVATASSLPVPSECLSFSPFVLGSSSLTQMQLRSKSRLHLSIDCRDFVAAFSRMRPRCELSQRARAGGNGEKKRHSGTQQGNHSRERRCIRPREHEPRSKGEKDKHSPVLTWGPGGNVGIGHEMHETGQGPPPREGRSDARECQ
jgi:hypothetical protein